MKEKVSLLVYQRKEAIVLTLGEGGGGGGGVSSSSD
jgi:hypothetical protein